MAISPNSNASHEEEKLWIDYVFLAIFLIDWAFCLFLVFSIPEPITGEYGFAGAFAWGPITFLFLIPALALYLIYQGWLLNRKLSHGKYPYQSRVRRVAVVAFILTLLVNFGTSTILGGAFQA